MEPNRKTGRDARDDMSKDTRSGWQACGKSAQPELRQRDCRPPLCSRFKSPCAPETVARRNPARMAAAIAIPAGSNRCRIAGQTLRESVGRIDAAN
jgi:hypothetical protein